MAPVIIEVSGSRIRAERRRPLAGDESGGVFGPRTPSYTGIFFGKGGDA